ncbi:hypothetical protein DY000_02035089 [Brassica cretica]|uniref:Uncharacterized protein n=1 Tax=Brassica cretica TaxID=69181 RepID=A0ABQ7DW43_BRACR|nr:hypothetical protein DY000_02035089 [Brassica cretica]
MFSHLYNVITHTEKPFHFYFFSVGRGSNLHSFPYKFCTTCNCRGTNMAAALQFYIVASKFYESCFVAAVGYLKHVLISTIT